MDGEENAATNSIQFSAVTCKQRSHVCPIRIDAPTKKVLTGAQNRRGEAHSTHTLPLCPVLESREAHHEQEQRRARRSAPNCGTLPQVLFGHAVGKEWSSWWERRKDEDLSGSITHVARAINQPKTGTTAQPVLLYRCTGKCMQKCLNRADGRRASHRHVLDHLNFRRTFYGTGRFSHVHKCEEACWLRIQHDR